MFKKYILEIVVVFFIRQLARYTEGLDFELFRKDLEERMRKVIPGECLDEIGVQFMNTILDGLVYLISNAELSGVVEALKNKDFALAIELVKNSLQQYIG